MKQKIFSFSILLLGAFFLFYPQTSMAISCKCTATDSYTGNKTTSCINLSSHPEITDPEITDPIITDCALFNDAVNTYSWATPEGTESDCEVTTYPTDKCSVTPPPTALENLQADLTARKPILEINIPGLNFSDVAISEDDTGASYFYIAWIPEMISALYKFLLAIVSIVAVVIIIIQGLHVITSGGGEGKTAAYKKIFQAIVGLFIAWGSYAILYNINPALVQFNALKVRVIEAQNLPDFAEMQNTTAETVSPEDANEVVNDTPKFENCPITLNNPLQSNTAGAANKEARTAEFYEKIVSSGVIDGSTQVDRIMQVADAAEKCGVRFGSCGRTAGTIWTLSGVPAKLYYGDKYLKDKDDHYIYKNGKKVANPKYPIPNSRVLTMDCLKTNEGCTPQEDGETIDIFNWPDKINTLSRDQKECITACKAGTGCAAAKVASTKTVMAALVSSLTEKTLTAEINKLKSGDIFWIYNANDTKCRGNHAMIFDKWAPDGINAQIIQGMNQQSQNMDKRYGDGQVVYGYICIKEGCGAKRKPISRIFRAN